MNDQSPPKRITRARAAAKTTDTGVKTAKIATAASKAKVTRNASTTKRKTRGDEVHEEENDEPAEIIEPELPKTTRGRGRKTVSQPKPEPEVEEEAPPAKTTRGRPKKAAIEAAPPAPMRSLRGRAKTVEIPEEGVIVIGELPKKPTRARAATVSKATAPKKSVKFEEPDKENIVPPPADTKGKAKALETGLKAKPVRKPIATTTTRATRGRAKVEEKEHKSSPLSPKKATQISVVKDQSEDELTTSEKTPMKPLMKSPIKAPGSIFGTAKKLDFSTSITANRAVTQDLGASMMGSPARRPPQSPFKESMKISPQRKTLGDSMLKSPFKFSAPAQRTVEANSPFKASMLQSPARRPQSPTKVTESGSPTRAENTLTFGVTPKASTFKISRFATPRTITKSAVRPGKMLLPVNISVGSPVVKDASEEPEVIGAASLKFSGRLSSIMPREVDPSTSSTEPIVEEAEDQVMTDGPASESIVMETIIPDDSVDAETTTPPASPPQSNSGAFALREANENPFYDSDSEDELASMSPKYSPLPLTGFKSSSHDFASSFATPTPFTAISKTPRTSASRKSVFAQKEQIGFTPLARQLTEWLAPSPTKSEGDAEELSTSNEQVNDAPAAALVQPSPAKSTFFDDEMALRDEAHDAPVAPELIIEGIHFEPVELDEEDLSLAHEADEMSLLEPEVFQEMKYAAQNSEEQKGERIELEFADIIYAQPQEVKDYHDAQEPILEPAPSEASQEYGDENAMPIDPALFQQAAPAAPFTPKSSTPRRVFGERVFHTVSKVPLKPAADDTHMRPSPVRRSASISKLPVQRPSSNLSRSNTVISYSPSKRITRAKSPAKDVEMQDAYETPTKPDTEVWSTNGTPARTPRRDLNTALLKGAVVYVDVHTTEGADASALFTELLTQMGARCVKRWDWNGNTDDGKIGITHVVFKDGGKRTLEKTRETGGIVNCVGVGWVLE
jgi:hypothetical protein